MSKINKLTLMPLAAMLILATGCTGAIHKSAVIGGTHSLSIDAKQRLVLVNNNGTRDRDRRVTCAEPSPDALAAQAAALSANASKPEVAAAALATSRSGSAASIGLRTQSIQILRDGYFRLCEAYMNGAIAEDEYKNALYGVDGVIAVVMAIDALSGVGAAPAVAISAGNASAKSGGDGTAADVQTPVLAIQDFAPERGNLSDREAAAIENIVKFYLKNKPRPFT